MKFVWFYDVGAKPFTCMVEVPEYVTCKFRHKDDPEPCGNQIPVSRDTLRLIRPEVPQFATQCAVCKRMFFFDKELSKAIIDELYGGIVPPKDGESGSQTGDAGGDPNFEQEVAATRETKPAKKETKTPSTGGADQILPYNTLADAVIEGMKHFGYVGGKWPQTHVVIRQFIDTIPAYQNDQGIQYILAQFGVKSGHTALIAQLALGTQSAMPMPTLPAAGGTGTSPFVVPGVTGNDQIRVIPTPGGGQIIMMPSGATPAAPVIQAPAPARADGPSYEDVFDANGKVVKRRYFGVQAGHAEQKGDPSGIGAMREMVSAMKDLGLLPDRSAAKDPHVEELEATVEDLKETIHDLQADRGGGARGRDPTIERLQAQVERLTSELDAKREKELTDTIGGLQQQIAAMQSSMEADREGRSKRGLSDRQFELEKGSQNLKTITDTVESGLAKVIQPLIDVNQQSIKLNGLVMLRQQELNDGVMPGTYVRLLTGAPEPSDADVQNTIARLRAKREAMQQQAATPPAPAPEPVPAPVPEAKKKLNLIVQERSP